MPKLATALTDTRVKALKPKAARYLVSDGGGLVLEVLTSGSKVWRYRYSLHGKQQPMTTIGDYPAISLSEARERARKYAKIVESGKSPVETAREDRGTVVRLDTVRLFGAAYYTERVAHMSAAYQRTITRALDKDIYPAIGNKPLSEVTALDVLAITDRIKARGAPQMALTVRNLLKRMFAYAVFRRMMTTNPAAAVEAKYVATQSSRTRVLSPDEIGTILRAIYRSHTRHELKLALHLLMLTMVRKTELTSALWTEFNLKEAIWRIPAGRMKKSKEHWVYLPTQAVSILRELEKLTGGEGYVFPSPRSRERRAVSRAALNVAVDVLKLDVADFVLHDFRRTASTHLHEMGCSSDAIETALAHSIKGVRGVYNRAGYAEERKRIMQLWADFVDAQIANPVKANFRGAEGKSA
jgi:integrase